MSAPSEVAGTQPAVLAPPAATAAESAPRLEIKFALDEAAAAHVELWLRTTALGFHAAHVDRQVSNLYFDTPDAGALADKLDGISARAKVRYRWYGDRLVPGPGQLEVKHRRNGVGWKETFPLAVVPQITSRAAFVRALRAALPPRARLWLDHCPEPMLINTYRRAYYASADGTVRATVDRALAAFDQRLGAFPQLARRAVLPRLAILELKLPAALRARAVRELADLGFIGSACSKYEMAVRAVAER